jgi:Concanavalin A-like lectin/glucanases superfamily/PEP-CTERM motif
MRSTQIARAASCSNPCLAIASIAAGLMLLVTASADAALKNRYSFTANANDSKGTAHGTVVDVGAATAVFAAGQLNLSANTGQSSNAITEDAYVDLPNGVISSAVLSGTNGAITLEFWATVAEQRTWQRFGDFGTSNAGENMSPSGSTSQYILITPNSGRFMNGLEMTNHPASNLAEPNVGTNGPFPVGTEQHVVAVYDHTNTSGGTNPNGTMALYLNGAQIDTGAIHPDTNLRTASDNNNWLGRSQWPDPIFDGSYNEFRIYDHAFTPGQARISFGNGPNGPIVPEPATLALFVASIAGGFLAMRRKPRS